MTTIAIIVQIVDGPQQWLTLCKVCGKPELSPQGALDLKGKKVDLGRCTCKEDQ